MIAGLFAGLLALLATGIPVGIGIGIVGIVAGYIGMGEASLAALPSTLFAGINSFLLIAIPLFILMSEILSRGGVTEILFNTVTRWLGHLPGGLAVSAVVTSAIGASITGSSVANAASMAIVCVPPLLARGYDRRFSYGLVAAAGTLGIMIPPSIPMLLYGEITEESIGALFMAGIRPTLRADRLSKPRAARLHAAGMPPRIVSAGASPTARSRHLAASPRRAAARRSA
jgi:C4-dicarboxylate transporter DctM subunit